MNVPPVNRGGYVLVSSILAVSLLLAGGVAILTRVTTEERMAVMSRDYEQAWYAAIAGIEHCLGFLRWDPTGRANMTSPTAGQVVCSVSHTRGNSRYKATAWAASSLQVKVVATGEAGRSSRTLGAIVKYSLGNGSGLWSWGGGNLWFDGGGTLEGEVLSTADRNSPKVAI